MTDVVVFGGGTLPVVLPSGPGSAAIVEAHTSSPAVIPSGSPEPTVVPSTGSIPGPPGPPGSGSTISVEDEGLLLSSLVQRLNFAGAGVGASVTGVDATITIPGTTPSLVTFNSSGTGIASGGMFNGSSAVTVSFNSIGAQAADAGLTSLAALTYSAGAQIPVLTAADTFALRSIGAASSTDILDRAAGDARYVTAGGGGLADGDKGDITVTGGVWIIDSGVVSLAKMADVASATVFYRKTAGVGAPEVQSLATLKTDLGLTGTNSGDQVMTLTGPINGSGTGIIATTITAGAVTLANMANVASGTVFYRKTAGAGAPETQTLATLKTDLAITTADVSGLGTVATLASDTDTTLAANSDLRVATQKAVKTYVDQSVSGLLNLKGGIDCSTNPNYPAATKGDYYFVNVGGKIGGASGALVNGGDSFFATTTNAGGTQAAVGASWNVVHGGASGTLLSANNLSDLASITTARTNLGLAAIAASGSGADLTNATVTLAKVATQAAATILGNNTAGAASPIALTAAQVKTLLAISASDVSGLAAIATSGSATDLSAGTVAAARMPALTGDVTSTVGTVALTIGANKVTRGMLAATSGATLLGATTAGNVADLTSAQAKTFLAITSADVSGLAGIATSGSAADLSAGTILAARMPAFTGDVTSSAGSTALTIAAGAVTLAKMASLAANSILGNNTGAGAAPIALTGTQVTAMLNLFSSTLKGLVPSSGGGTTAFLRADGSWAVPVSGTTTNSLTFNNAGSGAASGATFNGASAQTISYNTIGAQASSALLTAYAGQNWVAGVQVPTLTAASTVALKTVGSAAGNLLDKAAGDALYQPIGSYLTGNQTVTLSGDASGSGATAITVTIGANKVTRAMLAATSGAALLGATAAGNVSDLTAAQAKTFLAITSADVSGLREVLAADRTYFVATTGSDANTGLASGTAFATVQKAINTVYGLDLNGHQVTISVANGTYTSPVVINGQLVGGWHTSAQPLLIIGNEASPSSVIFSMTNNTALSMANHAYALVAGIKFQTVTGGYGWIVADHSLLEHRNCVFGSVVSDMIFCSYQSVVRAVSGTLTIAASAAASAFVHIVKHSLVSFTNTTIAFNTNAFSTYLWGLNDSTLDLDTATITGTKTGGIAVHDGSLINCYSLTGSYYGGSRPIVEDQSAIVGDEYKSRTYYVNASTGSDQNDGLASNRAFATIQAALDWLFDLQWDAAYQVAGSGAVINVADGTYAGFNLRDTQYADITITGNTTTPANVVVNGAGDAIVAIGTKTNWLIQGMKPSAASGHCIRAEKGSKISYSAIAFGTATGAHIYSVSGSIVIATGNYSIVGGAAWHFYGQQSFNDINGRTVTLTGTPAFSQQFILMIRNASLLAYGMTFTGSATGTRYSAQINASIDTNGGGATYLPGSVLGSVANGGVYV